MCRLQRGEQLVAEGSRGVVAVGEERVLDDHAGAAAGFQALDEVLEEQERGFARLDGEVLLDLLALLAAERGIGQDHVVAVALLDVGEVLGERVRVDDVRRLDAVEDHVHDPDDVGERFFLFAVEGAALGAFLSCEVVSFLAPRRR